MRIESPYTPKEYLANLRFNMSSHFEFGCERFTGFFLGRLFYVTYHSGYEWNRRITNQKNAAMGYVKRTDDGCEVRFMRFRGGFCPLVFLPTYLFLLICILFFHSENMYSPDDFKFVLIASHVIIAITVSVSTFIESLTTRSEDGRRTLLSMLIDPYDSLANYDKV